MSSFWKTLRRWYSTVFGLRNSCAGDVAVAGPLGDEPRDLQLLRREVVQRRRRRACAPSRRWPAALRPRGRPRAWRRAPRSARAPSAAASSPRPCAGPPQELAVRELGARVHERPGQRSRVRPGTRGSARPPPPATPAARVRVRGRCPRRVRAHGCAHCCQAATASSASSGGPRRRQPPRGCRPRGTGRTPCPSAKTASRRVRASAGRPIDEIELGERQLRGRRGLRLAACRGHGQGLGSVLAARLLAAADRVHLREQARARSPRGRPGSSRAPAPAPPWRRIRQPRTAPRPAPRWLGSSGSRSAVTIAPLARASCSAARREPRTRDDIAGEGGRPRGVQERQRVAGRPRASAAARASGGNVASRSSAANAVKPWATASVERSSSVLTGMIVSSRARSSASRSGVRAWPRRPRSPGRRRAAPGRALPRGRPARPA